MTYGLQLSALADPTRREIFERLLREPLSVGELAAEMPVSRPAVSQHLRVLLEAGLVSVRQDGRRRIYRPSADGLRELRGYVESLWDEVLDAFRAFANEETREGGER